MLKKSLTLAVLCGAFGAIYFFNHGSEEEHLHSQKTATLATKIVTTDLVKTVTQKTMFAKQKKDGDQQASAAFQLSDRLDTLHKPSDLPELYQHISSDVVVVQRAAVASAAKIASETMDMGLRDQIATRLVEVFRTEEEKEGLSIEPKKADHGGNMLHVLESLGMIQHQRSRSFLIETMKTHTDGLVRYEAMLALQTHPRPEVKAAMEAMAAFARRQLDSGSLGDKAYVWQDILAEAEKQVGVIEKYLEEFEAQKKG